MRTHVRIAAVTLAVVLSLFSATLFAAIDPETGVEMDDGSFSPKASLGFSLFYTWWRPMVPTTSAATFLFGISQLGLGNPAGLFILGLKNVKPLSSSAPVFGPSVLLQVAPRWTVSMNALYGKFDFSEVNKGSVHKLELDLIVSFRIIDWLRFYGGTKYFGRINPSVKNHKGGLGFGFAFNVNLYRGLYLLPNLSALTLADREYLTVGANGTVSLAYYFERIRLTIALGGRCQYMKDVHSFDDSLKPSRDDLFFGPYFSVVYMF